MNTVNLNDRMVKDKYSFHDSKITVSSIPNFQNNNFYNQRPLNQYSQELSFKGLSLSNVVVKDSTKVLEKIGSVLGDTFQENFKTLSKTYASRIKQNGNQVEFVRKGMLQMVGESLAYPFVQMPFDLADFGLKLIKKVPFMKNMAESMYNSKLLTNKRNTLAKEENFNALMGMFEQVSKKLDGSKDGNIDEWILNTFQKYFDPKTGKYNSVHERSLNRIVSGMIPAFFLANDAYNLSRFCDDNPEMADKEHKTRFRQELSRVGITAYIQLVILGGLTKFVNSSLMGTALSSTIPVLIAETSSRLANGKSITFISKEKAKEMAQEQGVISIDTTKEYNTEDLIYKYYPMPVAFKSKAEKTFMAFNGGNTFSGFNNFSAKAPENVVKQTADIVGMITKKRDTENQKNRKEKGLVSFDMIKKAMIASIAIGFSLRGLRANKTVDKAFNTFFSYFKDSYNKLVKHDFFITKKEFEAINTKLKDSGFNEIATQFEKIMKTHNADLTKLSSLLQEMINSKEFNNVVAKNAAYLKKHNINPLTISKSGAKAEHKALNEIANDVYRLGKIDRKFKPAVDFVIAPFRFAWATVKFPYTIINNLVSLVIKPNKSKTTSAVDILTKSMIDLKSKANSSTTEEFAKYIKTAMCSSFNNVSKSDYSNADLGKLTKLFASTVTTWFLIADDYNMVMMKSLGEDESGASLKAKERFQQRITGIFYQTLFIDLFNNTFRKIYHTSLLGMSAVTGTCTAVCEVFTRKSIGKPVGRMSREEINDLEYRNTHAPGLKGKYFRFMTDLTGKKAVSADANKKKAKENEQKTLV